MKSCSPELACWIFPIRQASPRCKGVSYQYKVGSAILVQASRVPKAIFITSENRPRSALDAVNHGGVRQHTQWQDLLSPSHEATSFDELRGVDSGPCVNSVRSEVSHDFQLLSGVVRHFGLLGSAEPFLV